MRRSRVIIGVGAGAAAVLALGTTAAAVVLDKYAVGVHNNPLRLLGLVQAYFEPGCAPAVNPIACHVAGRAWRLQSSGAPWAARAEGASGYRFELRSGDRWLKDARHGAGKERDELSDFARMPMDKDIWLAFTLEIEPGSPSTAQWVNLGQLHATADPGEAEVSPPWVQRLLPNDAFSVEVRHSDVDPIREAPPPVVIFQDPQLQRGRPYRFVYHFRLSHGPGGMVELWRDGQLVANYRGPIGYRDKQGPYFKFGVYRSPAPGGERFVAHYSDVSLGPTPPDGHLAAAPVS